MLDLHHPQTSPRLNPYNRNHFALSRLQIHQHGLKLSPCTHTKVQQVLGRVIHIGVDAILVSAVLAGIKRSTGLQ